MTRKNPVRIGVLNRANRKNNTGLETFEQHVVPHLLEDSRFEPINYDFHGGVRAITSEVHAGFKAMKYAKDNDLDVLFVPTHTQMMTVNPDWVDCKVIPYVHDTLVASSTHYGYAHQFKGRLWIENVKRCEQVIAASKQTQTDLYERHGARGKVDVIYQGSGIDHEDNEDHKIFHERRIDILYVGEFVERKNPELVRQVADMAKENGLTMKVVNREPLDVDCEQLTDISDEELRKVYANTRYYLHPSIIEGFGRTPIEAQAHGCVVLGMKNSINDEIVKSYLEVGSVQHVEQFVKQIRADQWQELSEAGIKNAKRFDFGGTRKRIKEVLIEAANK